ncbi:unnamed protein product, partial [Ectocarpus sp. 12 AP-2014]
MKPLTGSRSLSKQKKKGHRTSFSRGGFCARTCADATNTRQAAIDEARFRAGRQLQSGRASCGRAQRLANPPPPPPRLASSSPAATHSYQPLHTMRRFAAWLIPRMHVVMWLFLAAARARFSQSPLLSPGVLTASTAAITTNTTATFTS